ncbi:MAG TPA: 6-pyruvoyl tetrahydropterin synthase family protein [Candidatus Thermoplasmatota archaeon]|nr:6-pyruvoyl tetrahydropterin synthase family protein [Candidatus Thermoplasmatota archaeon]
MDESQLRIDGWRTGIHFDAAHLIPHHPKCGRLHGHTYALHVVVHGRIGGNGFILDFGDVKKALKAIADRLDHHVLIQGKSPEFTAEEAKDGVRFAVGGKHYHIPYPDALVLPLEYTSAEHLAAYVADELVRAIPWPAEVTRLDVGVDESYGKGAWAIRTLH